MAGRGPVPVVVDSPFGSPGDLVNNANVRMFSTHASLGIAAPAGDLASWARCAAADGDSPDGPAQTPRASPLQPEPHSLEPAYDAAPQTADDTDGGAVHGLRLPCVRSCAEAIPGHADMSVNMRLDLAMRSPSLIVSDLIVSAWVRAAACPAECDRDGPAPIAADYGCGRHRMGVGQVPRSRCQRLRFAHG
jgi:hypothetical protein